jgi:hypothetical protein
MERIIEQETKGSLHLTASNRQDPHPVVYKELNGVSKHGSKEMNTLPVESHGTPQA